MSAQIVEHWWNSSWGRLFRRDVRLQVETGADPAKCPYEDAGCKRAAECVYTGERCAGGVWQLYVRNGTDDATLDYRDETDARKQLGILLDPDPEYGVWRRIR